MRWRLPEQVSAVSRQNKNDYESMICGRFIFRSWALATQRPSSAPIETDSHLRHAVQVSLHALRRRAQQWLLRPVGVLGALLLLAALIFTGLPIGKLHAHADGDHVHEHATQVFADLAIDHDDEPDPADPTGTTTLHSHDLDVAATALPAMPVAMLDSWAPQALVSRVLLSPPSAAPRTPPHRPPIA